MGERVIIVPYDPDWPCRFDQERAVLSAVFAGREAAIEHVGSAAVPGLGAKPVIDVMVGLSQLIDAEGRIAALEAVGYEYVDEYERQIPERRYFRKPRLGPHLYHLHCAVKGSSLWKQSLGSGESRMWWPCLKPPNPKRLRRESSEWRNEQWTGKPFGNQHL